ncbi:oligosaccharide flippase family protein [uncultured Kordia sp.]|uniref:oligosaccharide flippase family protein n=1 Tax=uncultured Kordia sp. TaxID=507699 RepID=UPI0026171003|nr:oligosaccharide flippase family protein [uncultured Kordia sp.]
MIAIAKKLKSSLTTAHLFMVSVLLVNGGNYAYNLLLGRFLGPEKFADAAVLVTFLLVLSFVAMTFQLVTAKFSVLFEATVFKAFAASMYKKSVLTGIFLGFLIVLFASELQTFFKTSSSLMFVVFGLGIPLYFIMSVNRGIFQGKQQLVSLSVTYQAEMISRLVITLALLYFLQIDAALIISLGIIASFCCGLIPFDFKNISWKSATVLNRKQGKLVRNFFIITAFYELTQIIINNSDILLVKHYFESYDAGLYASLALIGRVVYFIAWMFVMLLLPTVVKLQKEGKSTVPILLKYVTYIAGIAAVIIIGCVLFPTQIVTILFGESYLAITPLLWKYALATGIFALSNIFAYYYLSLDKYIPVVLSGLFGMLQVLLVVFFHENLAQVVHVQIVAMVLLLMVQLSFFFFENRNRALRF